MHTQKHTPGVCTCASPILALPSTEVVAKRTLKTTKLNRKRAEKSTSSIFLVTQHCHVRQLQTVNNSTYLTYTGAADYTHPTAQPYEITLIHKHRETVHADLYGSHFLQFTATQAKLNQEMYWDSRRETARSCTGRRVGHKSTHHQPVPSQ